mgnify:CR=1 FL=1
MLTSLLYFCPNSKSIIVDLILANLKFLLIIITIDLLFSKKLHTTVVIDKYMLIIFIHR